MYVNCRRSSESCVWDGGLDGGLASGRGEMLLIIASSPASPVASEVVLVPVIDCGSVAGADRPDGLLGL